MGTRQARNLDHGFHGKTGVTERDILAQGAVEQHAFLQHHAHLSAERCRVHQGQIHAIHADAPGFRHVQPLDEFG